MGSISCIKTSETMYSTLNCIKTNEIKMEYESTIVININESIFQNYTNLRTDVIFIFDDDTRLHERIIEKKNTIKKEYKLYLYKDVLFPIKRTISEEVKCKISSVEVKKAIYRKILFKNDKIRISINKEEIEQGCRYVVCGEVEYKSYCLFFERCKLEEELMENLMEWSKYITFENLTMENIFSSCPPKIQMWSCFDPKIAYNWAYKWNGIKGKFFFNNNTLIIIPDVNNIEYITLNDEKNNVNENTIERSVSNIISNTKANSMCLQVEIMEDKIVIVELISCKYNNKIYTCDVPTNLKFLKLLFNQIGTQNLTIKNKQLIVQQYFPDPIPKNGYDVSIYDGFIIAQNSNLIKLKYPTFDAKFIGKSFFDNDLFQVGQNAMIRIPNNIESKIFNAIYEIGINNFILRMRNDRLTPSTEEEYKNYIECCKMLENNHFLLNKIDNTK